MVNYEEAFKKPFTDLLKLVIGIVLSLIPILHWIPKGFAIESSGLGKTKPSSKMPEWKWKLKDLWHLFIRGLLSDIIMIIYAIPAIVVLMIGFGQVIVPMMSMFISMGATPEMMQTSGAELIWPQIMSSALLAAPTFLVGGILLLIAVYVSPMAVMNYVKNNKFGAAFDIGTIKKKVLTGEYFSVWLVILVVTIIAMVIVNRLIPLLGSAIGGFIMLVIGYSLYGQAYREIK